VLETIAREGEYVVPSRYGDGFPITQVLLEDGARWSILDELIPIGCPVRILHGGADADVPWRHGLDLALAIEGENVTFTLIKDGDHRLSRGQDLERLVSAVEQAVSPT
ncbi:MAG: hypothetical protein JWM33_2176, partial [Caulobacteraceae bacterium]|nr:hypothetical protein [Caulobacteraceae bacterium]